MQRGQRFESLYWGLSPSPEPIIGVQVRVRVFGKDLKDSDLPIYSKVIRGNVVRDIAVRGNAMEILHSL